MSSMLRLDMAATVAAYRDTQEKVAEVVKRFETAYTQAIEAERLAATNQLPAGFAKWRTIFGDCFRVDE